MRRSPTHIYSHVGGGPMQRLARRLSDLGTPTQVVSSFTPESWRRAMSQGKTGRITARARAFLGFPLHMLWDATASHPTMVVTTNPFFLPFIATLTRPLHNNPVVVLAYDLYPDALEAGGYAKPTGWLARAATLANKVWMSRANAVVFIGEHMAQHAQSRYGQAKHAEVIETGADTSEFNQPTHAHSPLAEWLQSKKVVLSYVGNMGLMHDSQTLAQALPQLIPIFQKDNAALLVAASGPGAESLKNSAAGISEDIVRFVPPLSDSEWVGVLKASAVSLVTLKPSAVQTCIPSKAFSAMAAGSALLAVAPDGSDLVNLIRKHSLGVVVSPGNSDALVNAVDDLCKNHSARRELQQNAATAALHHYNMQALAKRWQSLVQQVNEQHSPHLPLKRTLDIAASALGLAATSPILLASAAAIRFTMGSPVFFRQERPGLLGKPFKLYKFRTMRHPKPHEQGAEHDGARLTRLGKLLRSTSVDELPTLLNVLKGEMSLVGPRPLLMRYLQRYTKEQARRHLVKPGITGWAQVNGRNAIDWQQKFELDVWYVENQSLGLDLKIIAKTIAHVLKRQGISQEGHATMPEFMGILKDSMGKAS